MTEHPDQWELDVIPPLRSITIILDVSPPELGWPSRPVALRFVPP
jgi:hypothetical protein